MSVVISEQQRLARAAGRYALRAMACALAAVALLQAHPAAAHHRHHAVYRAAAYAPIFEWIVLDADTGQVLGEQNADALTYPASLTKMMTLYLTFQALNQGRIRLDTRFPVSVHAANMSPSKLGLRAGDSVSVHNLILGIVTKSANDAATVLAEGLGGSEANFARLMTWEARQLGMDHSWFQNASGLPSPPNRTTARDIARLALALYHHFPREYRYFDTREFDFRGQIVRGHDHLLDWYPGADGIKTGFIDASGFNLASSAVRNGHRLIGVVMGGRTARIRDQQMASLLDQGFAIVAARGTPPRNAPVVAEASAPAQLPAAAAAPATAPATTGTARAQPVPTAAPAPRPAPILETARAVAVRPATATTTARAAHAATPDRSGLLRKVAQAALQNLAPVSRAEAAPVHREAPAAEGNWAIQLGAFHAEKAALHAEHTAARLAVARGKPHQILMPARHARPRLYRARLLHFTEKSARAACAQLRRRGIACSVVPPGSLNMASR